MSALHTLTAFSLSFAAVSICLTAFLMPIAGNWRREGMLEVTLPRTECKVPWRVLVSLSFDSKNGRVERKVDVRDVRTDQEMVRAIREAMGGGSPPVGIDAPPRIPWAEVVRLLQVLKESGFHRIDLMTPCGF
jgi:biopolymer transport protein ExbD